jgi:hypothetical protein
VFGDSTKEMAVWLIGMLVAAGLTILAVLYVVDVFIHPPDPTDPLTRQGGLKPEQAPKPGK